jgi:hypothetical protein
MPEQTNTTEISEQMVRFVMLQITQRKREHNRVRANDQKQPNQELVATFGEIQKALEKIPGIVVPEPILERLLLSMVRSGVVCPQLKAFALTESLKSDKERIEKLWSKG